MRHYAILKHGSWGFFKTARFGLKNTLDARGLLVRQRRGASERVVLVGERPLAQAVKSFERADPITLPFISPESKFDPGNLIGWLKKRFLKRLLLVKCAMILAKPVFPNSENKRLRMSIKGNWRRHGSEVVIRWCQRFFSRRFATRLCRSILSPLTRKKPLAPRVAEEGLSPKRLVCKQLFHYFNPSEVFSPKSLSNLPLRFSPITV